MVVPRFDPHDSGRSVPICHLLFPRRLFPQHLFPQHLFPFLFQVGLYATDADVVNISSSTTIKGSWAVNATCFNLEGTDFLGQPLQLPSFDVPGASVAVLWFGLQVLPTATAGQVRRIF